MYSVEKRVEGGHKDAIWSIDWFRPKESEEDGSEGTIVTGSLDDTVKVWKYSKEELNLVTTLTGHKLGVLSVAVAPNGKIFASSSMECSIIIWDFATYQPIHKIGLGPLGSWTVQFTADSLHILMGNAHGKVEMYSVETGKKEKSLETRQKMAMSIASSSDGKWIACGSSNGVVSLIEGKSARLDRTLEGHVLPVRALAFSPDSKYLLTGSDDKHIKVYTMSDGELIDCFCAHGSWVLGLAFSPDGSMFASSSSDKTVRIWDMKTGAALHSFTDSHTDNAWAVAWGSNNKLCSVGEDGIINFYKITK